MPLDWNPGFNPITGKPIMETSGFVHGVRVIEFIRPGGMANVPFEPPVLSKIPFTNRLKALNDAEAERPATFLDAASARIPAVQVAGTDSLMFGVGVNSNEGLG